MHIAIDARMYGTAQRGIGRYLMKLIENLEQVDSKNEYTIFLRRENFDEYTPKNPNFKKALWDVPWYGWREQVSGFRCQVLGVDLVHFPHWNVPLLLRKPFIVTIHDLELFSSNRTRENTTRGRPLYALKHLAFRVIFRHAVLASRAIIVPSNVVREQLLDLYPQARRKTHVIYEAPTIGGSGVRGQVLELKPNTYNLKPQRYALYVGSAYPHKNLPRLLEAWKLVHKELPDYKLVLVGREDFFWKKLKEQCGHNPSQPPLTLRGGDDRRPPLKVRGGRGSYDQQNGVIFYGETTDAELSALYSHASLLIQPSLEEGFSLTPLEALAHGTPVAVSDIPVHREILSEAAVYFDPHDSENIAHTMKEALSDQSVRDRILQNAKSLLPRYSWRAHAQTTLRLHEESAQT